MNLKSKLLSMQLNGTKADKEIAEFYLNLDVEKNKDNLTIQWISDNVGYPISTLSRFVVKLGLPSFKHFAVELINQDNFDQPENAIDYSDNSLIANSNLITEFTKKIKSLKDLNLYILTSRRAKALGKLTNERLNDGKIPNFLFHESKDNIENFVKSSKNNALILITLSGHSNIFKSAISVIEQMPKNERPKIVIFTAARKLTPIDEETLITIDNKNKHWDRLDNWLDYNAALLDIAKTIIMFLNKIYELRNR